MPFIRLNHRFHERSSRRLVVCLAVVVAFMATSFFAHTNADDQRTSRTDNSSASAEKSATKKPGSVAMQKSSDLEPISPKREDAAVAFAQQHHQELAELLTRLKASYPDQYMKALRELDKTRSRLERARESDEDRYLILLREWQLDSRVRLLAARLTMSTSEELERELRQTLADRHDARLQLLTYDREKSKARFQKMDEQIAEHVQNRESNIDREFDRIKKSAEMRKKSAAKPAPKRTGDKDK